MKILLLGKNGQLGWELQSSLRAIGEVSALDYPRIDFTDFDNLRHTIYNLRPDIIINAAAYTDVDQAEKEMDLVKAINSTAPGILAELANDINGALIHYSTDYVFDGTKTVPYVETDTPNPINVYGQSKWMGEQAIMETGCPCLILRTSWMYSLRRNNFVKKVLKWARSQPRISIVDDQIGSPTAAYALANITTQLIAIDPVHPVEFISQYRGIYHLGGEGSVSRYNFAKKILSLDPFPEEQILTELLHASTSDFPTPAKRPLQTALTCNKFHSTFALRLPSWQDALEYTMMALKKGIN